MCGSVNVDDSLVVSPGSQVFASRCIVHLCCFSPLQHPNVVRTLGAVEYPDKCYVVMEYCAQGTSVFTRGCTDIETCVCVCVCVCVQGSIASCT